MSYTPGPWKVSDHILSTGLVQVESAGEVVALAAPNNTLLIAAAPELLEALDNAHGILQVNLGDVDPHVRAACDLMWAAIAKAKGQS